MFKLSSISQKLMLIFFLVLLLVTLSLGLTSLYQTSQAVNEQVEEALTNLAASASNTVRSRIDTQLATLAELAQNPQIAELTPEALAVLDQAAKRIGYLGLGWVNQAGIAHYPEGNTADLGNRDYVINAFNGLSNMSNVIISRVINKPVIMLATPIYAANSQAVHGVLIARLDATLLSDITNDLGFGEQGFAFALNNDGTVIADRDPNKVMDQYNPTQDEDLQISAGFQQLITQQQGVQSLRFSGNQDFLVGYTPIANTNWLLGITANKNEVFSRLYYLQALLIGLTLAALIIGLLLARVFSQKIVISPLKELENLVVKIQQTGNLTLRAQVKGKDELALTGGSLNSMLNNFQQLVSGILQSSQQLFNSAEQLNQNSSHLLAGSDEQREQTNQLVTALGQMNIAIQEVAESTATASVQAEETAQQTQTGYGQVTNSQNLIGQLETRVVSSSEIVAQLNERTEEIDQALSIITSIAEQTNLLALNAAIEAARAGEHGRGFAVVADEVRTLASNSQEAAASISEKVVSFRQAAATALSQMQECSQLAIEGSQSAATTTETFTATNNAAEEILNLNRQIAAATEEQSSVVAELSTNVEGLNLGIEEVVDQAQAAHQAATGLQQLAEELQTRTASFQV